MVSPMTSVASTPAAVTASAAERSVSPPATIAATNAKATMAVAPYPTADAAPEPTANAPSMAGKARTRYRDPAGWKSSSAHPSPPRPVRV
jgi:hypothetical protein